jgi:putative transposase
VGELRACRVLLFARSSNGYKEKKDQQEALRMRIRDIASTRVRYGYRRIYVLLKRG